MSELILETILGEKHMVDILIYLRNFGPKSKTEIYRSISTSPHMTKKLEMLEEFGLVASYCVEGSRRIMNRLTPLGIAFADQLGSLEVLLGGDIDGYRTDRMGTALFRLEHGENAGKV